MAGPERLKPGRAELTLAMALALLLLALVSGATLFAYRQTIDLLLEERRQEAGLIARGLAARLAAQGWTSEEQVRAWVPQAAQLGISEGAHPRTPADNSVVGEADFLRSDRTYRVRVELDATRLLGRQRTLRRWTPALVGLDLAIFLLALLALRRFLTDLARSAERERRERLAESLSRLGEMAGGVAHEMRNGLATLRGYLGLIERDPHAPAVPEFLGEMRREGDQLQRVLDDFLTFARPGEIHAALVDWCELVERAAADPSLAGKKVEIVCEGAGWRAPGDRQLLERALRNLFRNAAEAEARAGRADQALRATLRRRRATIELDLEDRGAGVPASLRQRLFEPFATGHAGGVGLGLALSRRIVVLHGGTLELIDREGGGTLARLVVPAPVAGENSGNGVTEGNSAAGVQA